MEKQKAKGCQRLSVAKLQAWEKLGYGMFIHFGMSTFTASELPDGKAPSTLYAPDKLDVEQWVSVIRDAGMKYAVLTAKHVAGHCLWPSKHTKYHVDTSGNKTDVIEKFVTACAKKGIMPGLYYCSWDNHNRFGSSTPTDTAVWERALMGRVPDTQISYASNAYMAFQTAQLKELLTQYGKIGEVWIDIPSLLSRSYRNELYNQMSEWQPETIIMMNTGIGDGSIYPVAKAWPADIMAIERFLPNSHTGHVQWREIEGKKYYIPGEVCDPIGKEWFFVDGDLPRSDEELLGMYLVCRSRHTNLLLDVPPDKHGLIPKMHVNALMRLRKNLNKLGY
jgi:alpha-L-fucosidase